MRPVEPVDIERERRYLEILAIVLFVVSSIWVLWKAFRRPASLENSRPKEQKVLIGHKLITQSIMTPGKLIIFGFQTLPSPQGWIIGISSTGDMEQVPFLPVNSVWKNQPLATLSNGYIIAPVKRDYGKVSEIICIDPSGYRLLWKRPLPFFDREKGIYHTGNLPTYEHGVVLCSEDGFHFVDARTGKDEFVIKHPLISQAKSKPLHFEGPLVDKRQPKDRKLCIFYVGLMEGDNPGELICVDTMKWKILWRKQVRLFRGLFVDDEYIYTLSINIPSNSTDISKLALANGRTISSGSIKENFLPVNPSFFFAQNYIGFIDSQKKMLYCLDTNSLQEIWSIPLSSLIAGSGSYTFFFSCLSFIPQEAIIFVGINSSNKKEEFLETDIKSNIGYVIGLKLGTGEVLFRRKYLHSLVDTLRGFYFFNGKIAWMTYDEKDGYILHILK